VALYLCREDGYRRYTRIPEGCKGRIMLVLDDKELVMLSKLMSKILRHNPREYGVELDEEGWTSLRELASAVSNALGRRYGEELIRGVASTDPKGRFELRGGLIRARYGHSISVRIDYAEDFEARLLFHGTLRENLPKIMVEGIIPGKRLYVHLSPTVMDACKTASRRRGTPVYIAVDTRVLRRMGYPVYRASEKVYLTPKVPVQAIKGSGPCM